MRYDVTLCRTRHAGGFTLIEIAIVIIIIGLILGGVLKGQELIRTARTHNVADQGSAIKAAILGFTDRFQELPGDYKKASDTIPGIGSEQNGDGNGRVGYDDSKEPGKPDEANRRKEAGLVWLHLAKSGFVSGEFDGKPLELNDETSWNCRAETCLINAFKGPLMFLYDNEQTGISWASDMLKSNQLWSGKNLPVEVLAELDRKLDDGKPSTGNFRVGDGFLEGSLTPVGNLCAKGGTLAKKNKKNKKSEKGKKDETTDGTAYIWDAKSQVGDCGAVLLF